MEFDDIDLGNIFVALDTETAVFDPAVHARTDIQVKNVTVKWAERDFWSFDIEGVAEPGVIQPGRTRVFISEMVDGVLQHTATGRLDGWPFGRVGQVATYKVVCRPKDSEKVEIDALSHINDDPFWNFSDPEDKRLSDVVLAARSSRLHWTRFDNVPPVLADLIEGDGLIDIGDNFIEGSLEPLETSDPVIKVEGKLTAEWPQAVPLAINVGEALGNDGNLGTISTKTLDDLPRAGESIGDWTVLQSSVSQVAPPGGLDELSRQFLGSPKRTRSTKASTSTQPTGVTFIRRFFDIDMIVASVLTATRRETLTFVMKWGGQEIVGYDGSTEKIELECRNMRRDVISGESPAWESGVAVPAGQRVQVDGAEWVANQPHVTGASFYADYFKWDPLLLDYSPSGGPTPNLFFGAPVNLLATAPSGEVQQTFRNPPPGYCAIKYILGMARAKIVDGVRVVRQKFDIPWQWVRTLTGRERMRITDPSIPGGEMVGKIVEISADWIRGVASITIAAAPGTGGVEPVPYIPVYPFENLVTQGVIDASVYGQWNEQEAALAAYEYPAQFDLVDVVERQLSTRISIVLSPTSGNPDLEADVPLGNFVFNCDPMVDLYA